MLRKLAVVLFSLILAVPVFAQAKKEQPKPEFDYKNLEKTSAYMWQWKVAIYNEEVKARRNGNDLSLIELQKKFAKDMEQHEGQQAKWPLRFEKVKDGRFILSQEYKFKGHGIYIDSGYIGRQNGGIQLDDAEYTQEIEPWMHKLRTGDTVYATGTIEKILFTDRIVLSKVIISAK